MLTRLVRLLPCLWLLSTSFAGAATEVQLHVVRFPERRDVRMDMVVNQRIPQAKIDAKVNFREGQMRIELSYDNMKPAVLFGGNITSYVLWAVNRDGQAENLGELWVRPDDDSETVRFSTGLRSFALMITAEPYFQVAKPSEFVLAYNDSSPRPPVGSQALRFSDFGDTPRIGLETLANVRYDGDTPLDILQAEKAYEIAEGMGAKEYASELMRDASVRLEQAAQAARSGRAQRGAREYARQSFASSNEAIRITLRNLEAEALERRIAERRAEMEALENRLAESEAQRQQAEDRIQQAQQQLEEIREERSRAERERARAEEEKRDLEREMRQIETEKAQLNSQIGDLRSSLGDLQDEMAELQREKARIQADKEVVEDRLSEALGQVAETRNSARGTILNLPDILFDVDQATLKPEAKVVIAKLAGILLIMKDLNLRIEGHTDSTGSPSYNLRLSERRAASVFDFLFEQGISGQRMKSVGYGMERPIADNSTAAGRSQNRRVEIIIAEGVIAESEQ